MTVSDIFYLQTLRNKLSNPLNESEAHAYFRNVSFKSSNIIDALLSDLSGFSQNQKDHIQKIGFVVKALIRGVAGSCLAQQEKLDNAVQIERLFVQLVDQKTIWACSHFFQLHKSFSPRPSLNIDSLILDLDVESQVRGLFKDWYAIALQKTREMASELKAIESPEGTKLVSRKKDPHYIASIYSYQNQLYFIDHKKVDSKMGLCTHGLGGWRQSGTESSVKNLYALPSGRATHVLKKWKKFSVLSETMEAFFKNKTFENCPNIVHEKIFSIVDSQFLVGVKKVKLIAEKWDCDLLDLIRQEVELPLDTQMKNEISLQLLTGLSVIHLESWYHRDIKPENCLVRNGGKEAAICDFGLAGNRDDSHYCGRAGTKTYTAPEFRTASPPTTVHGAQRADLFSMGLTLFELRVGRRAEVRNKEGGDRGFIISDEEAFKRADPLLSSYEHSEDPIEKLIWQMLSFDPMKRPTASEARNIIESTL